MREIDDLLTRPQRLGTGDAQIHAELRGADQIAISHVETCIAQVAEDDCVEWFGDVLLEGEEVGQDLRGVPFVGQAVVDRHAGPLRQLLGGRLGEAAVLDGVVHAPEHTRGVLDGLLVAHVRAAGSDEGDVCPLVV